MGQIDRHSFILGMITAIGECGTGSKTTCFQPPVLHGGGSRPSCRCGRSVKNRISTFIWRRIELWGNLGKRCRKCSSMDPVTRILFPDEGGQLQKSQ